MVARSVSRETEEGKAMGQSTGAMSVIGNDPMHSSGKFRRIGLLVASICVLTLQAWAGDAFAAIGFVQGNDVTKKNHHVEAHHLEEHQSGDHESGDHESGAHQSEDHQSALSATYTSAQVAGAPNV